MNPHGGRRATVALGVQALLAALVLSGCGGSDGTPAPSAGPSVSVTSTSPSTSASTSPSTSPSGSTSAGATSSAPSSSVTPAAGDPVTLTSLALRLPAGWKVTSSDPTSASAFDSSGAASHGGVQVFDQASFGGETLDSEARLAIGTAKRDGMKPVRQPDLTVGGVEGFVVTGSSSTYPVYYVFGTVTNGHDVTVTFTYTRDTPDAQATIASVLASITWT